MVVKGRDGWYLKKVDGRQLKVERGEGEKANAEKRRARRCAETWGAGDESEILRFAQDDVCFYTRQ
jgi:hypothetical protein